MYTYIYSAKQHFRLNCYKKGGQSNRTQLPIFNRFGPIEIEHIIIYKNPDHITWPFTF